MGGKSKDDLQFEALDRRLINLADAVSNFRKVADAQAHQVHDRFAKLTTLLENSTQTILDAIAKINSSAPPAKQPLEVRFMFVVKDDHEPVNFSLVLGDVTDAEGNPIPDARVDVEVLSSDDSVLAVTFDSGTKSGTVSFGNPGVASITASVSSGGTLLGSGAADFTVTVGDPAAISSVALKFDGISQVDE